MIREITITAVLNGYVVRVGCQTLVFQDMGALLAELHQYLTHPEETEKDYRERGLNAKYTFASPEVQANMPTPVAHGWHNNCGG